MKILLIMPDAHMHKLIAGPHVRSMREVPLTLGVLAALVPPSINAEIKIVDESVDPVPMDCAADIVGISVITGCARRAYRIADHFRSRGIPVVLGGVHVTILPEEACEHADSIVVGLGEHAWPSLLEDFSAGRLKPIYYGPEPTSEWLAGVPTPRLELHRRSGYMMPNTVQATRGCRRSCDFCSVKAVWKGYLRRPVDDVVRDIRQIRGKFFVFNDVSLVDDPDYAAELFRAIAPLKKCWGGLATVDIVRNPNLLDLMAQSGCRYLLFGFESTNQQALSKIHKGFNYAHDYRDVMQAMHERGIAVQGCFVFGFDHDDATVFRNTVEEVLDLKVDIPRYSIYTPYPGTELFGRLLAEDRILSFSWDDYDTMHVVYRPAQMTPEELYSGFKWAYRETFRTRHIASRVSSLSISSVINFFGNLTYQIFARRLYTEARFATPYSLNDPGKVPARYARQT